MTCACSPLGHLRAHRAQLGVSVIDRFTHDTLSFFESARAAARRRGASGGTQDVLGGASVEHWLGSLHPRRLLSHVDVRTDLVPRALADIPLTDFFAGALPVRVAPGQAGAEGTAAPPLLSSAAARFAMRPATLRLPAAHAAAAAPRAEQLLPASVVLPALLALAALASLLRHMASWPASGEPDLRAAVCRCGGSVVAAVGACVRCGTMPRGTHFDAAGPDGTRARAEARAAQLASAFRSLLPCEPHASVRHASPLRAASSCRCRCFRCCNRCCRRCRY